MALKEIEIHFAISSSIQNVPPIQIRRPLMRVLLDADQISLYCAAQTEHDLPKTLRHDAVRTGRKLFELDLR